MPLPEWDAPGTRNATKLDGNAHYVEDEVPQDRSPSLSDNDVFSSWREQSPMIEDLSSSSESTNDDEMDGDGFFTLSRHVAKLCLHMQETLNITTRYFSTWFLGMTAHDVYTCEMFYDEQEVMEQLTGRNSEAFEDGSFSQSLSMDDIELPHNTLPEASKGQDVHNR